MTKYLLATQDEAWPARVRDAFDGRLNGDLRTLDFAALTNVTDAVAAVQQFDPAVLVVGPAVDDVAALEFAVAIDALRPDIAVVLITEPAPKLLEQAVRAGVRDVIDPSASADEMRASLDHALEMANRRRATLRPSDPQAPTSKVITVVSPKGGAGKTAIASNLAVGLGKVAPNEVVIVDFDLQFGDVANALRLTPERTMADVVRSGAVLDATTVKAFLTPHPAGVFVLCAPDTPAEADAITSEVLATTLDLLAEMFRFVVIDTGAGLDEATLTAMEHSTDLVVVCATDVSSARALRKELEAFDVLGLTTQRRHFALNRADARVGLTASDITETVGLDIAVSIPSSRAVPTAMNQGSPILESNDRTTVGKALGELVHRFAPPAVTPIPQPTASGPVGLLRRMKEAR
ncbi:MAG TPA: AAA family ATPase [Acidimicrobiia bacterium]|jgi:pilus assembly protein CpaE|nr:AAA family ATPase [Acidimicrobiia bacterium]